MKPRTHLVTDINPETGQHETHTLPTAPRSEIDRIVAEIAGGSLNDAEQEWADRAFGRGWHARGVGDAIRSMRANPDCPWAAPHD